MFNTLFSIPKIMACLLSLGLLLRCNNYPCSKNHINPAFIGYALSDIDTFILRAYTPHDNYQHLVDSFIISNRNASVYTRSNDTTVVYVNDSNPDHWISAGFDWKIYIPATNKTVSVSDISSPPTDGGRNCINPIQSFVQDGRLITPSLVNNGKFYASGYLLYIHN